MVNKMGSLPVYLDDAYKLCDQGSNSQLIPSYIASYYTDIQVRLISDPVLQPITFLIGNI